MTCCAGCGQPIDAGAGCTVDTVDLEGGTFHRLPLGGESADWWVGREPDDECHDCTVRRGQHHHVSCDMEQCPRCGDQLLACGCDGAGG